MKTHYCKECNESVPSKKVRRCSVCGCILCENCGVRWTLYNMCHECKKAQPEEPYVVK